MARGLGHALQRAIAQDRPAAFRDVQGPTLGNARRRFVFRFLCLQPCAHVGTIAKALGMSPATVRWHEADLVSKGYLDVEGAHVFPRGLIDPADVGLFTVLGDPGRAAALVAIFANPGITVSELASALRRTRQGVSAMGSELARSGLITLAHDGRFRRHYPTDALHRKREANLSRGRAFADAFVHRLEEEGLAPEVIRHVPGTLLVRFGPGSTRVLLDIPLDPYATAWQGSR